MAVYPESPDVPEILYAGELEIRPDEGLLLATGHVAALKPLSIACGEGALELLEVQLEGRKRLSAADFTNGQRLTENEILGATS